MRNRLNRRNLDARLQQFRQQCRRPLWVALSAGIVCFVPHPTRADGELQLTPPLNSTLTIRQAKTNWTQRDDSPLESQSKATVASKVAAEPVPQLPPATIPSEQDPASVDPVKPPIRTSAIPTAGPLDRFRGPQPSSPGMQLASPETAPQETPSEQAAAHAGDLPTPGEAVLDRIESSSRQAFVPRQSGDAWQNRPTSNQDASGRSLSTEAAPNASPQATTTDGFRAPAREGNWVARDAINRVAPLRDPAPITIQQTPSRLQSNDTVNAFELATKEPTAAKPTPVKSMAKTARETAATAVKPEPESNPPATDRPAEQSFEVDAQQSEPITVSPVAPKPEPQSAVAEIEAPKQLQRPNATETPSETTPSMSLSNADDVRTKSVDNEPKTETLQPLRESNVTAKMLESLAGPSGASSKRLKSPAAEEIQQTQSPEPSATDEGQELPTRRAVRRDLIDPSPRARSLSEAKTDAARSAASGQSGANAATGSVGDLAYDANAFLDYSGRPAQPIQPNRIVANMQGGIERTLRYFYARPEVAVGRSNWGMMHSMMVFGADTQLIVGREKYSAIAWIAGNNNCRGQRLLTQDANGLQAKNGVGLQGHQGQFLAILGMCDVPSDYPLYASSKKYSVADLVESEKRACKEAEELTFTLIGLAHYLDTDSSWMADDGTRWDFERVIEEELKQPIVGSACGGTHRLMGYAHALRKRRAEGKPITGQWKRAEIYTQDFIDYAYSLQNRDGSMSTEWFEGRGDKNDVDRKIQTTGHIVEWLLTVTPDDQLQNRRLVAAVNFLLRSIGSDLQHDWSIGPKGHALRSLAMYHQRVFRGGTPWVQSSVAQGQSSQRTR